MFVFSACNRQTPQNNTQHPTEAVPEVYNERAGNVIKTETVYTSLDASGNIINLSVTDWLHTDKGNVFVDDISNLENIQNIKSNAQPVRENGILRWHMKGTDLYYTGTIRKVPPVAFEISYYLEGEKILPDNLAGKSGNVTIKIKIKNNAVKEVTAEGIKRKIYLPVIAVGGMILPENVFSSVKVENGQSFGDGTKQLVVFTSLPGFSESLGFAQRNSDGIGGLLVSDEITVSAVAEKFSLENMYFAVLPLASLNFDIAMPETVDDVKTALSALRSVQNAMNKIDPDRLIYSFLSDEAKVNSLLDAANEAAELYNKNQRLIGLIGKYSTPENAQAIDELLEALNEPEVQAVISVISDPEVQSFINGLPIIMENFGKVTPILGELQKDMSDTEVQNEISALPETVNKLSEITKVLSENEKEINALLSVLDDNGAQTLENLFASIDPEDFEGLEDKYGGYIEDSDLIVSLTEEWLKFGQEYGLFTSSAENMSTSLMFVYNTKSIAFRR